MSCGKGYQMREVFCIEQQQKNFVNNNNNHSTNIDPNNINTINKNFSAVDLIQNKNRKVADQFCWQIQKPVNNVFYYYILFCVYFFLD